MDVTEDGKQWWTLLLEWIIIRLHLDLVCIENTKTNHFGTKHKLRIINFQIKPAYREKFSWIITSITSFSVLLWCYLRHIPSKMTQLWCNWEIQTFNLKFGSSVLVRCHKLLWLIFKLIIYCSSLNYETPKICQYKMYIWRPLLCDALLHVDFTWTEQLSLPLYSISCRKLCTVIDDVIDLCTQILLSLW